jgi:tRNA threonylcarbamoyladenosine biosynthesis protein TsaE
MSMTNCPPSDCFCSPDAPFDFISSSEEETQACGRVVSAMLGEGSVVALRGGLGAGKTYFTKGIAQGLGVEDTVTSPTYTIVSEYEAFLPNRALPAAKIPLYHIDAYRLAGDADFEALGGADLLYGGGVCVIEWSERVSASIPEDALIVTIEVLEDGRRRISGGRR